MWRKVWLEARGKLAAMPGAPSAESRPAAEAPQTFFAFRLEQARLRAMLAVEETQPSPRDNMRSALRAELSAIADRLGAMQSGREQRLMRSLGLGPIELDLLWTVVAVTCDPQTLPHAQLLSGNDARRGTSLALFAAMARLPPDITRGLWVGLGPAHPLLRYDILRWNDDAPGIASTFTAPHRVVSFLAGDDDIDAGLAAVGGPIAALADPLFDAAQQLAVGRIAQALADDQALLVILEGPREAGRRCAVAHAGAAAGLAVVDLDVHRVAPNLAALEAALGAQRRECVLRGALALISDVDELAPVEGEPTRLRALARALDSVELPTVLTTSTVGLDLGVRRRILRVRWPIPNTTTRQALWQRALGTALPGLDNVALRYPLGAGAIGRAVETARVLAESRGPSPVTQHDLVEGVRNNIAERLGHLAQRIEIKQKWEDLVLSPDTTDQVRGVVARVKHAHKVLEEWGFGSKLPRGIGVAALFSGPPGTGKTMVAELIARELDLELYQIDLSKVVSKWVGETEKQLSKIFDAADAGHALLLFDEADSLFAKRTEVKAAVDRYANLEVNYLLQRIENFGGITVLTTNMDTSIDPALRRRLACHIVFWPPDDGERAILWQRMLPPRAPLSGTIDFNALSHAFPDMTGANIRNAAIAAAFLAAAENSEISMAYLQRAGKAEYRAMGRVLGNK